MIMLFFDEVNLSQKLKTHFAHSTFKAINIIEYKHRVGTVTSSVIK